MLGAFGFLLSPKFVANLHTSAVALYNRNTAVPILRRSIRALAVLLCGDTRGAVSLDSLGLFIETLGADTNGDALAPLGRDLQVREILEIATGRSVRPIACRRDDDFFEHRRGLFAVDITAQRLLLREKNRGGKPRIDGHRF